MPRILLPALLALCSAVNAVHAAEPDARCRYRLAGQLPIQYHGASMGLTLEGQINRMPAMFLMDTGASSTFMTRLGTDKRALWLDQTMAAVSGIGGISRLYRAPIRHLQIGPINSTQQSGSLLVIDEMGARPEFDAIIGSDFLLSMDLEISLAEKLVKFFSPKDCEQTFLGYWDPAAVVVPLKLAGDDPLPIIEIELNGVKMNALIDTGATLSSVTRAAAARAGVTPTSSGVTRSGEATGIGLKTTSLYTAVFKKFSVGEEVIYNPVLQMMEGEHKGFDVILGNDFQRAHRILLAASQKAAYFSYIGGKPFNDGTSTTWIQKEAVAGNSYGQFIMATGAWSNGADSAGREWMQKAAASNNPLALHYLAREHGHNGKVAESVAAYEKLIALDSHDLTTQLELFAMRTRHGKAAEAKAGLTAAIAQFKWPRWPAPIAEYYLGKITFDEVLRQARKESDVAKRRECEAAEHAEALQDALGKTELAAGFAARIKDACSKKQ